MKRGLFVGWIVFTIGLFTVTSVGCLYRYHHAACKERAAALQARSEALERDAREQLKIGTKKEAVIGFFKEHNIPVTFTPNEASGTISVMGCAPSGCGSDAAILGVRVGVDQAGTVISAPVFRRNLYELSVVSAQSR